MYGLNSPRLEDNDQHLSDGTFIAIFFHEKIEVRL